MFSAGQPIPLNAPPHVQQPSHLKVLHWVPVMLQEYYGVCGCQIESKATDAGCQEHDGDARVLIELLHNAKSL